MTRSMVSLDRHDYIQDNSETKTQGKGHVRLEWTRRKEFWSNQSNECLRTSIYGYWILSFTVILSTHTAPLMAKLEQMLPNGTVFEFLDEKERMDSSDFVKRMRRMRKPRVSSFVVMANTEVMANLTKVVSIISKAWRIHKECILKTFFTNTFPSWKDNFEQCFIVELVMRVSSSSCSVSTSTDSRERHVQISIHLVLCNKGKDMSCVHTDNTSTLTRQQLRRPKLLFLTPHSNAKTIYNTIACCHESSLQASHSHSISKWNALVSVGNNRV